ncbi:hypothetical protein [Leptospira phage LE3]|uniref:Uncharacterized protein n=2 Tax=Nylescharonvirus TaxID=2843431 RepID=A0A343LEF0_9CAUD|nr:hypothetical protein HWB33_gp49 [Leptospira phage LE3]YP_009835522.1 hypothetical protein HWB34_gp47 [Leptospira phage LE4]ATN94945.1 hypothetical protein [Leptospira phage LE3]ATN95060.1 hypothetical protein [Leptospira phage LE4]
MIEFGGVQINLYYILVVTMIGHLIFDVFKFKAESWLKNVLMFVIATVVSILSLMVSYYARDKAIDELIIEAEANFLNFLIAVGYYASFTKYISKLIARKTDGPIETNSNQSEGNSNSKEV